LLGGRGINIFGVIPIIASTRMDFGLGNRSPPFAIFPDMLTAHATYDKGAYNEPTINNEFEDVQHYFRSYYYFTNNGERKE
jgi:hypothetical protein